MKNLPKKYIESMMDAQSQIIAQQQEIERLKALDYYNKLESFDIAEKYLKIDKENTKLKEEIRILKQDKKKN